MCAAFGNHLILPEERIEPFNQNLSLIDFYKINFFTLDIESCYCKKGLHLSAPKVVSHLSI